jgi:hydrogenase expression/formation protein HypC
LTGKSKPDGGTGGNTSMCLGIPMQIMSIDGYTAHCEARGVARDASLFMLQEEDLQAGDYIVVHLGYAIQKITPQEARTAWELYDEMLEGGYA